MSRYGTHPEYDRGFHDGLAETRRNLNRHLKIYGAAHAALTKLGIPTTTASGHIHELPARIRMLGRRRRKT